MLGVYGAYVLVCPPHGEEKKWTVQSKSIDVPETKADSEEAAVAEMHMNIAAKITDCNDSIDKKTKLHAPQPVPWVEISCIRTPGSKVRKLAVKAPPPRRLFRPDPALEARKAKDDTANAVSPKDATEAKV